ncbi:reverse transcriptase domain-containing protein [Tanacetum coccineum]
MKRYGVNHYFSTSYHPQTSGQVENTNKALKRILEKTVKDNPAIWSRKPTDTTPYKLIYGKSCHLPFEIEHRAYWALKNCNPDLITAVVVLVEIMFERAGNLEALELMLDHHLLDRNLMFYGDLKVHTSLPFSAICSKNPSKKSKLKEKSFVPSVRKKVEEIKVQSSRLKFWHMRSVNSPSLIPSSTIRSSLSVKYKHMVVV